MFVLDTQFASLVNLKWGTIGAHASQREVFPAFDPRAFLIALNGPLGSCILGPDLQNDFTERMLRSAHCW